MKYFLLVTMTVVFSCKSIQMLSPEQTREHLDQDATVCFVVSEVFTDDGGSVYLDYGAQYPDQTFSVYIPKENVENVNSDFNKGGDMDLLHLTGKSICVTGGIFLNKGKPQIIAHYFSQFSRGKVHEF